MEVLEAALVYDADLSPDPQWLMEAPDNDYSLAVREGSLVLSSSDKELRLSSGLISLTGTSPFSLRRLTEMHTSDSWFINQSIL